MAGTLLKLVYFHNVLDPALWSLIPVTAGGRHVGSGKSVARRLSVCFGVR